MRKGRVLSGVADPGRSKEHPLLGVPQRDAITALVLTALTAALLLLVADHTTREQIQRIDSSFLRRMVSIRSDPLTAIAKVFDALGRVYVTLPVRFAIAIFLGVRRRWWHFAAFATSIVLSEISIGLLKGLYDRARPPGALVTTSASSFPSGHAVAASVTVVAAVIALLPEGAGRYAWGVAAAMFSAVMGISRAYLGAHWLSDAAAGVLLGTSVALCVALVVHVVREGGLRVRRPDSAEVPREQLAGRPDT